MLRVAARDSPRGGIKSLTRKADRMGSPNNVTVLLLALGMIPLVAEPTAPALPTAPERVAIFPPEPKHNHASCIVEIADGSLLAVWYSGSGERKADDVVIQGAWLRKGSRR